MKYIRIPSAQKKLKLADAEGLPVYVSAPTGWGKTVLLRNYYQRRSAIFLSGINGRLSDTPDPKSNSENVFIIDDINWITDEESKRYVHELLDTPGVRVVMCGRGRFPRWLILTRYMSARSGRRQGRNLIKQLLRVSLRRRRKSSTSVTGG